MLVFCLIQPCPHTWVVDVPFKLKLQVFAFCSIAMGIVTIVTIGRADVKSEVAIQQLWDSNAFLPQVSHEEL